jgi:hypothetical protein
MATQMKRARVRIHRKRGSKRSIPRMLARDEDLRIFLRLSRESLRVTALDLDELIRPA